MNDSRPHTSFLERLDDPRKMHRLVESVGHVLLFVVVLGASYVLLPRLGFQLFLTLLALAIVGSIYAFVSFRSLVVPFLVWFLAIGGFRFLWSLKTPLLPDLYLDRITMSWLMLVFLIKTAVERKALRPPYVLDTLILVHGLYLWIRIFLNDNAYFHIWTMSYLVPYSAYFMAKNILTDTRKIRIFLSFLLVVLVYYEIVSVAEKFDINWLIWPKFILLAENRWAGRSGGPYLHGPLFGTVIGMMLPVHLYFLATVKENWKRILLYVSLFLCFLGLYFTYTRGAWLAGVFALIAVVATNRRHYFRIVAPALVVVPLLSIYLLGMGADSFIRERATNENTIAGRLGASVTALRMFQAHPIVGVGFFQFRVVQKDYVKPVDLPVIGTVKSDALLVVPNHDIYLGPLAEDGLVGAFLQGGIYLVILRTYWHRFRKRRKDHFETYIMPILGGMFLGYLVGGLAIDYRFFSIVGTLFYISAALLYGHQPDYDSDPVEVSGGAKYGISGRRS